MTVYLGTDHRGFNLKEQLKSKLMESGYKVEDCGADKLDAQDDYVDFAQKVAEKVSQDPDGRGILLCGSGAGMDIVANKFPRVWSALAFDLDRAKQAREHEDVNVLSLPADVLDSEKAWDMVQAFLTTPFSNEERHIRRLKKIQEIEEQNVR